MKPLRVGSGQTCATGSWGFNGGWVISVTSYSDFANRRGRNNLWTKVLRAPNSRVRIRQIDLTPAERLPGVQAVHLILGEGAIVLDISDDIALVVALDEETAQLAVNSIRVDYESISA